MHDQFSHSDPATWIDASSDADHVSSIFTFLREQGTFNFPSLSNGLFPAAAGVGEDFDATGYRNVWIRDNVQIAYAHFRVGQIDVAVNCVRAIATFLSKHHYRFENIIEHPVDASDPMCRPHVRFNGEELTEISEKWSHSQNDALGYFLWIYGVLVGHGHISVDETDWNLVALIVNYFAAIEYWRDEDSGHWEETRKISASSIGVVKESLNQWLNVLTRYLPVGISKLKTAKRPLSIRRLQRFHDQGEAALQEILPAECIQPEPTKARRYDAALLFLCYPLSTLPHALRDQVVEEVASQLQGDIGIRRYNGDSYWCANYKAHLPASQRSTDFSDDLSSRDRLLEPGTEAQWCIFDPTLSCFFGMRYAKDLLRGRGPNHSAMDHQIKHLQRSLAQLTVSSHPLGAYRCPESYYLEHGVWVPNDLTPLLWTQANLMQALWWLEKNLRSAPR